MQCFAHLGYPKTGTTTLQNRFFRRHPDIIYLGIPFSSEKIRELVEVDIMMKDEIEFCADAARELLMEEIIRLGGDEQSTVVLSCENLSFSRDNHRDRAIVARRLKEIFPALQFIVTIRNQFEFISSMYKQSVFGGMFLDFQDFLEISWRRYYRSTFPQLKYYEYIRMLQALVGNNGVHVMCYEQMRRDPAAFMENLCGFLHIAPLDPPTEKENVGLSRPSLAMKRLLNRIVPYELGRVYFMPRTRELGEQVNNRNLRYRYMQATNNLVRALDRTLGLKSHQFELDREWEESFQALYSDSNRALQRIFDLALEEYGYPV